MRRREFLRTASLGAAAFVCAPALRARTTAPVEGNRLRIPPTWSGGELVAEAVDASVWSDRTTRLLTYGSSWPGPTIRVRRGDRFAARFVNRLQEDSNVHWHGLVVPPSMDGHPMDVAAPGASIDYEFDVVNHAGTYWYHPHPHGRTAPQVYAGMAGFLIVEDDEEQALDLPRGDWDVPLLIQDRWLQGSREIAYAPNDAQRLNGLLGDEVFVNGTPQAYLEVDAGLYRFRVLNGSNARILRLGFTDGRAFRVIGTDGGLLDRPYEVTETRLAPAERVELLVDLSDLAAGETVLLKTLPFGTASTPGQQGFELDVMTLVGTGREGHRRAAPATLATLPPVEAPPAVDETFMLDTTPIPQQGHHHRINGEVFEMHAIVATAERDRQLLWEIRNNHTMPHPIHIHGTQFRIVERDGTAPVAPRDLGWKDTIQLDGRQSARVALRFAHAGTYLLHCHNLEHEDEGMMINFAVTAPTGVASETASPAMLDLR